MNVCELHLQNKISMGGGGGGGGGRTTDVQVTADLRRNNTM